MTGRLHNHMRSALAFSLSKLIEETLFELHPATVTCASSARVALASLLAGEGAESCQVTSLHQLPPVSQASQHKRHASLWFSSNEYMLLLVAGLPAADACCAHHLPPQDLQLQRCALAWCNHHTPALVFCKWPPVELVLNVAGGLAAAALVNAAFGCGSALWWFVFFWGLNGLLQVSACTGILFLAKVLVLTWSSSLALKEGLNLQQSRQVIAPATSPAPGINLKWKSKHAGTV